MQTTALYTAQTTVQKLEKIAHETVKQPSSPHLRQLCDLRNLFRRSSTKAPFVEEPTPEEPSLTRKHPPRQRRGASY